MPPRKLTDDERAGIAAEFHRVVNMPAAELQTWLGSRPSRSVGMRPGGGKVEAPGGREAVGHRMGRRIVQMHGTKNAELTEQDYRDMRKVVGYVHRHMTQRPDGDVTGTRWRKSLMNWGHDPLRG